MSNSIAIQTRGPARWHGFELMDQPWWPRMLRDGATNYLRVLVNHLRPFEVALPALREALQAGQTTRIVDLCSGGSGPWETILPGLKAEVDPTIEVLLTDLYPNQAAAERCALNSGIRYEPEPVNALSVRPELEGLRAIVNGLHHFRPEDARQILADAVSHGQPIAVLELLQRTWRDVFSVPLVFLSVLFTIPRVRPVRISTLFLTYVLPVLPLAMAWDTFVSTLRCYRPEELLSMAESVPGSEAYVWSAKASRCETTGLPVTYLVGYPRATQDARQNALACPAGAPC
ncbi:MAG: class I SAM-dependent methyltransferase [Planctomycetes bacterium]|nr:class I SAM-dependent methyltransferase [Planctomycetota bacterium]